MKETLRGLWSSLYGLTLLAIGIACAGFVAYRIIYPEFDARTPLALVISELAALGFISIGAITIGIERIRRREILALRPLVKPDEVLVEKFGPKGSFWESGAVEQIDRKGSSPNRQMESDAQQAARGSLKR